MLLCICSVIDLRSSDHILDVICDQLLNRHTANMARLVPKNRAVKLIIVCDLIIVFLDADTGTKDERYS